MAGAIKISDLRRGRALQMMQVFSITWLSIIVMSISIVMIDGAPAAAPTTAAGATPPAPTNVATAAPPPAVVAAPPPITEKASPPLPITTNTSAPPQAATAPKASPPAVQEAPPPTSNPTPPMAAPAASPPEELTSPPPNSVANHTSPPPAAAPKSEPAVAPPKAAPPALPPAPASAPTPAAPPDLDIAQISALSQLKVPFDKADPCETSDDILLCDQSDPPRHLISLSLHDCPLKTNFSTAALLNLSSLQSLELVNCSVTPVHVPSALIKNLQTFICSESLGRTGSNQKEDKLSGVWLSKLTELRELSVTDVELSVSGLNIIVQNMKDLTQLIVSRTNMPGILPRNTWPDELEYIDVSGNSIRGTLPSQMRSLVGLKHLDLSDNQIKGVLPNIFGDLQQLQYIDFGGNQFSGPIPGSLASLRNCSHLDLSNNNLNGSIPANITSIKTLKYLDLSQNELSGPIPFNASFLKRLTTLKLGENTGLCYNHTALKSRFLTGIRNCVSEADDTGLLAPAPSPASSDLSASSGKSGSISKGAAAGISVVVIVAAAVAVFVARKWWKSRDEGEQFLNLRKNRL